MYQLHDIVLCQSGHVFIITEKVAGRPKYPYIGKAFHGQQKTFRLGPSNIIEKIGVADPECGFLNGGGDGGDGEDARKPTDFDDGQRFANVQLHCDKFYSKQWAKVASLDFGDLIKLHGEGNNCFFVGIKKSRHKYPVTYERNGKRYKCGISRVSVS